MHYLPVIIEDEYNVFGKLFYFKYKKFVGKKLVYYDVICRDEMYDIAVIKLGVDSINFYTDGRLEYVHELGPKAS